MQNEQEDCPICLNTMESSDAAYPLTCPTHSCHYNFCQKCIYHFQHSAADDYQMASDGSHQVKVHFKCPQCREKYQCSSYPSSEIIVQAVLLLRQASALESVLLLSDSDLSATILNRRNMFLKSISMEQLQDAIRRLQTYVTDIGKPIVFPHLDWNLWRSLLVAETSSESLSTFLFSSHPPLSTSTTSQQQPQQQQWIDPTLFYGLDELMTRDEQEFVTHLMVQGKPELLSQGAYILHGILDMTTTIRPVEPTSSSFSSSSNTRAGAPRAPPFDPAVLQRVRNLYPLPSRMPRCVRMPRYDLNGRAKPLKFEKESKLSLTQVRGPAGRLGLRKGDVVTHVNGENVHSLTEFQSALEQNGNREDTFWLTVNCDDETAQALYERYQKMTREKVDFKKHR